MNNTLKVILATLVIYGAGVVTGGLLVDSTQNRKVRAAAPPQPIINVQRKEFLPRLDRQLSLTQEQFEDIEAIIDESNERTKSLWEPIAPQVKEELRRVHGKIRTVLTAEQRKKFDADLLRPRPIRKPELTGARAPTDAPATKAPLPPQAGPTNVVP